jgi:hypothetical protein
VSFRPGSQIFGYPPVYFPNAADFSSAEAIQLVPGQTMQAAISLVEQAYYPVKVTVSNLGPDPGIRVSVFPQGHQGPGYSLGYSGSGQIQGLLPNGTYTIEATSFGQPHRTGSVGITVDGRAVEGPPLILVPNRAIPVDVKEEFTSPADSSSSAAVSRGSKRNPQGPSTYLRLYLDPVDNFEGRRRASLGFSTRAGDDPLRIEDVRAGRYWLEVDSSRGYASSITSGGIDLERQPLVVPAKGPIEITMRDDWAEVEGSVEGVAATSGAGGRNRSGLISPQSSAHVYFLPQPESPGEFRDASVSPEGKILTLVPPGLYRVVAFDRPQGDLEYHDREAMRAYENEGQLIRLLPGQNEALRVPLISTSE